MTYSVKYGMGARGVPQQVVEAFQRLANQQRGRPERAMLNVLFHYGGGPLYIVEHVGDLIHRMSQQHAYDPEAGRFEVLPKIDRALRSLRHPYGFRRELAESIANNACYRAAPEEKKRNQYSHAHDGTCAATIAAYKCDLDVLLLAYADEHRKLPVYNRPQQLAQAAAVALGEQRFEDVTEILEELLTIAEDDDRWVAEATACQLDAAGWPVPLEPDPRARGRYLKR